MKHASVGLLGSFALAIAMFLTITLSYFETNVSANTSTSISSPANKTPKRSLLNFANLSRIGALEYETESYHRLAVPFYRLSNDWKSTLTLNNQAPEPLQVAITLFSLGGERLDVPSVTIPSHDEKVFDIAEWATDLNFQMGSLHVRYFGADRVISGAVKIKHEKESLIFDQQLMQPEAYFKSSRLEGVWWMPSHKAEMSFVLSNTSEAPLTSNLALSDAHGNKIVSQNFSLAPYETKLISTNELLDEKSKLSDIGGLSINHTGKAGSLFAESLIQDEAIGFSSLTELHDPGAGASSRLDGAGLRIGHVNQDKLNQVAVARNVGEVDTLLTTRVLYTNSDGKEVVIPVRDVKLKPGESSQVDLSKAIARAGIGEAFAGLEFKHDGPPGSVVVSSLSVSENGNQVFRVPLIDAQNWFHPTNSGKYHLTVREDYSSLVYLKNVTDEPQVFYLSVEFPGGLYVPEMQKIKPGQTLIYDLRKLRDDQIPDEDGRRLPLDLKRGFFSWSARSFQNLKTGEMEGPQNRVMIGRYEGADFAAGMSSTATYGCGCQVSYADSWIERQLPDGSWTTNTYVELNSGETAKFRGRELNFDCGGWYTVTAPAAFGVNSALIGTVTQDGNNGIVTAVDGGDLLIGASWFAAYWYELYECCQYEGVDVIESVQIRVKPPQISSITPARGPVGNSTSVTISGQRFRNSQTLTAGNDITVTINSRNSTTITATFAVSEAASSGNRDVKLITQGAASSNAVSFYVQVPFAFTPSEPTQTNLNCQAGNGFGAQVPYTVTDNEGQPILLAGMTPEEKVTSNGVPDQNYKPFSQPASTLSDGKFTDIPIGTCFNPPPPTNICIIVKQEFRVKVPKTSGGDPLIYFLGTTVDRLDCLLGIKITVKTGTTTNEWTLGNISL